MEQKVDEISETLLKKIEELTPMKPTPSDDKSKGSSTGGGSAKSKKPKSKKKKQLKMDPVKEEEEDANMEEAEDMSEAGSKRKADDDKKSETAKKSKTPQKAPPSGGKAVKQNSYGQNLTSFIVKLDDDAKATFQQLLSRSTSGDKLLWTDFQSIQGKKEQVTMAVNLAVLTAVRRAKERGVEADPNKLHAYLQFTAKANLPKVVNDMGYCDKQIDKINTKGHLFSLLPTEIVVKDFPNCAALHLSKRQSPIRPKMT